MDYQAKRKKSNGEKAHPGEILLEACRCRLLTAIIIIIVIHAELLFSQCLFVNYNDDNAINK